MLTTLWPVLGSALAGYVKVALTSLAIECAHYPLAVIGSACDWVHLGCAHFPHDSVCSLPFDRNRQCMWLGAYGLRLLPSQ